MGRDIRITPNRTGTSSYSEIQFSGPTISTIKLKVEDNGDIYFSGSVGTISNIYDNTSNVLMSIRGSIGTPVFQVSSNDYVQMGKYSSASLVVSVDKVGVGTTAPSTSLHIKGPSGSFRLEDGNQSNGYVLMCDSNGVASWKPSPTSSSPGGFTFSAKQNYITKFTSTGITSSIIYQNSNKIGVGVTTSASARLHIIGTNSATSSFSLKLESASASPTLYVRNDGYVYSSINGTNTKVYYGGTLWEFVGESSTSITSSFVDLYTTSGSVTMSNLFKRPGDKIKSLFSGTTTGGDGSIDLMFGTNSIAQSGTVSTGDYTWELKSTIFAINSTNRFKSESIFTITLDNSNISYNKITQNSFTSSFTNSFTMSLSAKGSNVFAYMGIIEFLPGSSN